MKSLSIILVMAAFAFASCKKENQQTPATNPLTGKWAISKINAYMINVADDISNNIIYQKPLADSNFMVFNTDGTCVWSFDHYYYYGENGQGVIPQKNFRVTNLNYALSGKSIQLYSTAVMGPMGPSNFSETDRATLQAPDTLIVHSIYSVSDGSTIVADTWYTRK